MEGGWMDGWMDGPTIELINEQISKVINLW